MRSQREKQRDGRVMFFYQAGPGLWLEEHV